MNCNSFLSSLFSLYLSQLLIARFTPTRVSRERERHTFLESDIKNYVLIKKNNLLNFRYPYVRYSYGNTDTGLGILTQSESVYGHHSGIRDIGTKRWLEGKLNAYNTSLFTRPDYQKRVERPLASARSYVRYMPVDDALDMYKKRCMTVGTLSKYWLSPATWASRREKELNLSSSLSRGNYSYSSRFDRLGGRVY
nr:hypothetical protein C18B2.3 - Caenorhabditis elegans [Caenorhabditis elegans]